MNETNARESAEYRHLAAAVVENACGRAIGACIDMMQAAQTIGVHEQLGDVREALVRLQAAAKAARGDAKRMLDG
ncbi:hypothetical protein PQQ53_15950 [Paraburkholderia strydomiana]|jgi:SUMO ligase MMS21 Smc5/6 complex component|uniref:Uncharacterized protein n=1 Tax=Paraburkholderia strydomiana TaxID=1245417 RepID=A0ABW9EQ66_9BURK